MFPRRRELHAEAPPTAADRGAGVVVSLRCGGSRGGEQTLMGGGAAAWRGWRAFLPARPCVLKSLWRGGRGFAEAAQTSWLLAVTSEARRRCRRSG